MTELKTLKDFFIEYECEYLPYELKKEAIKWRKKSMKLSARCIDYQTWDNFFNISEEDLK